MARLVENRKTCNFEITNHFIYLTDFNVYKFPACAGATLTSSINSGGKKPRKVNEKIGFVQNTFPSKYFIPKCNKSKGGIL